MVKTGFAERPSCSQSSKDKIHRFTVETKLLLEYHTDGVSLAIQMFTTVNE